MAPLTKLFPLTAFDQKGVGRTLGIALLLCALVYGVMLVTDGQQSSPGIRLSRLCALAPGFCLVASALVSGQRRAQGERRALEALGVSPDRQLLGQLIASVLIGLASAAGLCGPKADLSGLFPAITRCPWQRAALGNWIAPGAGLILETESGKFRFESALALSPQIAADPRALWLGASVLGLCPLLVLWYEGAGGLRTRLIVGTGAAIGTIAALHWIASGQLHPAFLGAIPMLLLLHWAVGRKNAAG